MWLGVCRQTNSLSACFSIVCVFVQVYVVVCVQAQQLPECVLQLSVCVFVQVYVVVCVQAQQLSEYMFRHAGCVYVVVFVFVCLCMCVCAGLCGCVRASSTTP
jgi:hypothetical protein